VYSAKANGLFTLDESSWDERDDKKAPKPATFTQLHTCYSTWIHSEFNTATYMTDKTISCVCNALKCVNMYINSMC